MYFTAVDMDNLSNIVLGGTKNLMIPTLSYFSPNQALNWQKQITGLPSGSMYREVTVVKFQHQVDNSPYLLVLLPKTNTLNATLFLQINSHTGAVVQAFREFTPYTLSSTTYYGILGQITSQKVLYLNTGDIYVTGISMLNQQLNFARFSISSSFVSVQTIYSHSTYQSKGMTLTMTQDQNFVILGAEFNLDPGYELTLHKSHRTNLASVQWELNVAILGPLQDLQISHLGTSNLGSTTIMTLEQKVISNFNNKIMGIIKSPTNVYFGGSRSISSKVEAFFESFNNETLCSVSSYLYSKNTNLVLNGKQYNFNPMIGTTRLAIAPSPITLINTSALTLIITNDPHSSCTQTPNIPTLTPINSIMPKQIFYIQPSVNFNYLVTSNFTGDEFCSDKKRSYSLIPPIIPNLLIEQNTGLITYLAANQVHGIDQSINVQVQQIDGKLAAIYYPIDFIDCRDVYITELLIENQVFVLNQEMTQTLIYKAPIYSKDMCSQYIELTVTFRNGSVIPSSFMSSDLANNMLIFNTSEQSYLDICQVQYKYPGPQTFTYYLGRLEKISFQDLEFYSNCDYSISIKPYTNPGYPLPSYIRYSSEFQEFNIYTNDQNQKGIHQILIKATLETDRKIENSTFIWTLIIEDDPIQFGFSLELSNQIVFVGQESFYELPLVVNPFNESYEIKTEISMIQSFAKFDGSTFSFFPYLMDIGEYTLEVSLLNLRRPQKSKLYNFKLKEKDILELKFSYQFSNLKTYLRRQLVEGDSTQNQYVIKKEIPQQLDQDEALAIAQTGNAISAAMTASVYFNFILQFFLSAALSIIWGALNNLQLITHLPLFQINFTSNFRYFVLFLIDISNLNLIPTPDFLTENLQFNQEDTIDEDYQLEDMYQLLGYESCFFPSNLANLIVNFLAIVAFMAVERIIQRGLSQKQQKLETVQINTEKDMLNTAYQDYQSRIILDQQ
eukprot:403355335